MILWGKFSALQRGLFIIIAGSIPRFEYFVTYSSVMCNTTLKFFKNENSIDKMFVVEYCCKN
jgi:hypothetical protein